MRSTRPEHDESLRQTVGATTRALEILWASVAGGNRRSLHSPFRRAGLWLVHLNRPGPPPAGVAFSFAVPHLTCLRRRRCPSSLARTCAPTPVCASPSVTLSLSGSKTVSASKRKWQNCGRLSISSASYEIDHAADSSVFIYVSQFKSRNK
jgi:hypothetical protein